LLQDRQQGLDLRECSKGRAQTKGFAMKTMVERAMSATFRGRTMFDALNEATDYGWELLEAAIAAALQWQPIETAPKDGTSILGWMGEMGGAEVIWWSSDNSGWDRGDYAPGGRPAPTHWAPIPEPPK
jgi:hypothetical protein